MDRVNSTCLLAVQYSQEDTKIFSGDLFVFSNAYTKIIFFRWLNNVFKALYENFKSNIINSLSILLQMSCNSTVEYFKILNFTYEMSAYLAFSWIGKFWKFYQELISDLRKPSRVVFQSLSYISYLNKSVTPRSSDHEFAPCPKNTIRLNIPSHCLVYLIITHHFQQL